jgi:peptide/nickel transport system substrate-binding protein
MTGTPVAAMSGRDRIVVLFGVVVLGILGAGVLVSDARTTPGGAEASPGAGTLVEGVVGRATSVDPLEPRNAADLDLIALVYSGLTRSFPDGTLGPDLAESWTISDDATVYTFTLRAGARWHDGQPVTADDVVFTVLTIQNDDYQGPLRASWRSVRVEKINARTVRFTLVDPVGAFLQATTLPILPAHLLLGVPVASLPDAVFNRQPVGSGPYRLAHLDFDQARLELAAPSSAGVAAGPTASPGTRGPIRRLVVRFYPDGARLAEAYRLGAVDTAAGLPPAQAAALRDLSDTTVLSYPSTRLTTVVPNVHAGHTLFTSADVRRGLLHAMDREGMITRLLGGAAQRADSPISPVSWAYSAKNTTVYSFDPAAAHDDFTAAGWTREGSAPWLLKDGTPVAFSLAAIDAATDPLGNSLAHAIADGWTSLGLSASVVEYEPDGFVSQLVRGDFDLALLEVNMGLDPDVFPLLTSSQAIEGGSNVGGYQSAALDRLLRSARLGVDRTHRTETLGALQAALTRDLPLLPIDFAEELYVVRGDVVGPSAKLVSDRSGRFWDVLTWRLADDRAAPSP